MHLQCWSNAAGSSLQSPSWNHLLLLRLHLHHLHHCHPRRRKANCQHHHPRQALSRHTDKGGRYVSCIETPSQQAPATSSQGNIFSGAIQRRLSISPNLVPLRVQGRGAHLRHRGGARQGEGAGQHEEGAGGLAEWQGDQVGHQRC